VCKVKGFEVNQGEIVGLLGPNGAGKQLHLYDCGLVQPNWETFILMI
jgi:ABC-type lipopolysaccharide export system ATPase subunit